jgi:hypothetical protein
MIMAENKKNMSKENNEQLPENTDPIDSPNKVENSNDAKIDQDFPGYPHYPATEDIMNPSNHTERVTGELDSHSRADLNRMHLDSPIKSGSDATDPTRMEDQEDLHLVEGTSADVTETDMETLKMLDRDMDNGEDENRVDPDFRVQRDTEDLEGVDEELNALHADAMDVPGEETDDANEEIGEEDEENNYYSLGGDGKD